MPRVIVQRSMHEQFLSNTYLVADRDGGRAVFVDAGGPVGPLIEAAEHHELTPTHALLTHHHFDHVCELDRLLARWPELSVLINPLERDQVAGATDSIEAQETIEVGELEIRALATPGHTAGMLSFLIDHVHGDSPPGVFTGDTLFRDSVGGVRAPGHTTFIDLKDSIMGTLMELAPDTDIYPGHAGLTSVGREWESNPFIRVWRGLDREGDERCIALGDPATLILLGDDYDGGHKAWVRWPDGSDDIVPGSQVKPA
jgi:glyoxylase-like metal-dependent hydrolase (beta-lactamase superfamily II)